MAVAEWVRRAQARELPVQDRTGLLKAEAVATKAAKPKVESRS